MTSQVTHHDTISVRTLFRSDSSTQCFDYWLSLNDGRMPRATDWDPVKVHRLMPWSTILERGGETGYRLRFAGTALCDFYGEEMTGQAVGYRMDDAAREFYFANIEEILRRPCATFMTTQARSDSGRDCLFECLALPLSDENGKGIRLFNHQVIVETLPYGEAKTRFAMPDVSAWIDLGAGTPDGG